MVCCIDCFSLNKVYKNTPIHILPRSPFFVADAVCSLQCIGMLLSFEVPEKLKDRRALQEHILHVTLEYGIMESLGNHS